MRKFELDSVFELQEVDHLPTHHVFDSVKRLNIDTIDLGGEGDCLLRCIHYITFKDKVISRQSFYSALNKPLNDFLEDDDLVKILKFIRKNALVVSVKNRVASVLFDLCETWDYLTLLNFSPHHYVVIENMTLSGIPLVNDYKLDMFNFLANSTLGNPNEIELTVNTKNIRLEYNLEQNLVEDKQRFEERSPFPEENERDYKEDPDLNYFMSFCLSRLNAVSAGLKLNNLDSKLYYKLRHNVFKTFILESLSFFSEKEKPFRHFEELDVDSGRTPDFLANFGDFFLLLEFTVCNRYDSVLRGKDIFSKYNAEIKASKVLIRDFYVFLSLDGSVDDCYMTIEKIANLCNLPIPATFKEEADDILETFRNINIIMNDFCPEILTNNNDLFVWEPEVKVIDAPEVFTYFENKKGKRSQRGVRIKNLVFRNKKRLDRNIRQKPDWGYYSLVVNLSTLSCYFKEDDEGNPKDFIIDQLNADPSVLINLKNVIGKSLDSSDIFSNVTPLGLVDRESDVTKIYNDEFYESTLLKTLLNGKMQTVADCDLNLTKNIVPIKYEEELSKIYDNQKVSNYIKTPFIFHPKRASAKGRFNLRIESGGELTDMLIDLANRMVLKTKNVIVREFDVSKLDETTKQVTLLGQDLKKILGRDFRKVVRLNDLEIKKTLQPDISLKVLNFKSVKRQFGALINETKKTEFSNRVRINIKTNNRWKDEKDHFFREKNTFTRFETEDNSGLHTSYKSLIEELFEMSGFHVTDNLYPDGEPLGNELSKTCKSMRDNLDNIWSNFSQTNLCHSLLFISQWCYQLMFYSNVRSNKDDFFIDNLGYDDCLLMVKGGKRAFSTKTSRFFRLLFPVTSKQSLISTSNSTKCYTVNGKLYMMTPWRQLRLSYLKKGFETFSNFGNYYVSTFAESSLILEEFNKFITIKVLLLFSQNRKLEVWFSTFRYLYFNSYGTHSDVLSLITGMPIHNKNSLIYLFQSLFISSYVKIFESSRSSQIFDLFWQECVGNKDLLVERFEEQLFMTKSPFSPISEHLVNLKSVFDTHEYFLKGMGIDSDSDCRYVDPLKVLEVTSVKQSDSYFQDLNEFDFNFDPSMSFLVGKFAGQHIGQTNTKADLSEIFSKIMNSDYTKIATGKGMRDQDSNFWGKKGFDVVFPKLKFNVKEFLSEFPNTYLEFKKISSSNQKSFFDKINGLRDFDLEFDMKDKEQYKGSREIYVMTETTKLLQNPIELFFKKLCSSFPNELIQKPSHSRPKFIHSKMFDNPGESKKVMYCTLDCRKWAPRSNLWKYFYFIKGMSDYLPEDFVSYFFIFWTKMFYKKIRIQKNYVDIISNSEKYKNCKNYLTLREDGDFNLQMPYSFMMGIFNFLSSLMHASSQMYFNEKIALSMSASINFVAHSDDSAGLIYARDYKKCLKVFETYEKFQRSLNHLMSRKKCCLSERNFEIISIMYVEREFIPMTHKFITNVSFDPKGSGWYEDICVVVSKVVDLFSNGGSYLQCYSMMLTMSELIRKAYHLPRSEILCRLPLCLGGVFNMHPIHLILMGSSSQEIMLDYIESYDQRLRRIEFLTTLTGEYIPAIGSKAKYLFNYYRRHELKPDLDEQESNLLSAFTTLPERTTLKSINSYYQRLTEFKFVASLTGIDTYQMLLTTLFTQSKIVMGEKVVPLKEIPRFYYLTQKVDIDLTIKYSSPNYEAYNYIKEIENIKIDYSKIKTAMLKTCKPCTYNLVNVNEVKIPDDDMMVLAAVEKDERILNILSDPDRYLALRSYLFMSLPGTDFEKSNYLKNFNIESKEDKLRSGYMFMPSRVKIDNVSRFVSHTLLYCTRKSLISSQSAQYFTPGDMTSQSWIANEMKHRYLTFRILDKRDFSNISKLKQNLSECKCCNNTEYNITELEVYRDMYLEPEFKEFSPRLPFCDYTVPQIRGKNVWVSGAFFKIYTLFGTIESFEDQGKTMTEWKTSSINFLPSLWAYYKLFCQSRGISYQQPVMSDTGFVEPRLAFNDFDTPYVPQLFSKAVVLLNSLVRITETFMPKIFRRGKKFVLNSRNLDFEIYSLYDINKLFFDKHGLVSIKDQIFDKELEINKDLIMTQFESSKTYKILKLDLLHTENKQDKYKLTGLLGSKGSFTRALALADLEGIVRYRSSASTGYIERGVIEFETIENVPVLDLFSKLDLRRVRLDERISLENYLLGHNLSYKDQQNLVGLKNKLGLEAFGSAITSYSQIFSNMSAGSIASIPKGVVMETLSNFLDCLNECVKSHPSSNDDRIFLGTRRAMFSLIKSYFDKEVLPMSKMLTKFVLRAKSDNPHKFNSIIKLNNLANLMLIRKNLTSSIDNMFLGMLNLCRGDLSTLIFRDGNYVYKDLVLSKKISFDDITDDYEDCNTVVLCHGDPKLYPDAFIDCLTSDDIIDEDDYEEEELDQIMDREFEGDLVCIDCFSVDNLKSAEAFTILNDNKFNIRCPYEYICFPWLGKCDMYTEMEDGLSYYVTKFPGNKTYHKPKLEKFQKAHGFDEIIEEPKKIEDLEIKIENGEASDSDFVIYRKLVKDKEKDIRLREIKKKIYVPEILTSREDAIDSLKMLGFTTPMYINHLFPIGDFMSNLEPLLKLLESDFMNMEINSLIKNRKCVSHHLPGYRSVLKDPEIVSELKSIFGENCYKFFEGGLKIEKRTANSLLRSIKRNYKFMSSSNKAFGILLISCILDSIQEKGTDSWFVDVVLGFLDDIESKLDDSNDTIIAIEPQNFEIPYVTINPMED